MNKTFLGTSCKQSILPVLLILAIAGTVFAGGEQEPQSGAQMASPKINFLIPSYKQQPPSMTNGVLDKLESLTGTEVDILWVPDPNYTEKFSLLQVSGDLPDVTYLPKKLLQSGIWINAAQSGVFWEISEEKLRSYENLAACINDATYRDAAVNGRIYGIPKSSWSSLNGLFYRSDWLSNVGMEPPETLEEIYNVAKAFTHNDPDGNGIADTYGFSYIDDAENETAWAGFDAFVVAAGGFNQWGVVNGKVIPYFDTPEYITAMNFLRKLYEEELMNADFPLVKGNQKYQAFNQGKVGIIYNYYTNLGGKFNDLLAEQNTAIEDAREVIDVVGSLKNVDGKYSQPGSYPVSALFAVNKTTLPTEGELENVLEFFNISADFDGEYRKTVEWGLEGVHYNGLDEKGTPVRTEDQNRLYDSEVSEFATLFRLTPLLYPDWKTTKSNPMVRYGYELRIANEPYTVANPLATYLSLSKTYVEQGSRIQGIISDARVKYIMGILDEEGFKAEVVRWKKQGGTAIINELEAVISGK